MRQAVGPRIECGVVQALVARLHGEGERRGQGLGGDALVHPQRVRGCTGLLAEDEHFALRVGVQQLQTAQRPVGISHHLPQQVLQVGAQSRHLRSTEARALIAQFQTQAVAQFDAQRQRVAGALAVVQWPEGQAGRRALLECFGDREVFEHQQRVEQRPTLLAGPALDVVERHLFVVAKAEVECLQLAQPRACRLGWRGRTDDRQGIDEQAQLLLDARQRRGPPGDRGAKHHAILAGVALQQQAPGALQYGVEGHFMLAGESAKGGGELAAEHHLMVGHARAVRRRTQRIGQQGRCLHGRKGGFPERFARRLLLQPAEVIAELSQRRRHGVARVMGNDFAEQLGVAPAVHQDVVAGENEVPGDPGATHQ
ncbi:hypothetical protein [Pseudomonas sp. 25 E 4]|nr:hypothetical protein [Pseudomonas sp. 25 E 4]